MSSLWRRQDASGDGDEGICGRRLWPKTTPALESSPRDSAVVLDMTRTLAETSRYGG
jgi:hypothetical protein